MTTLDVDLFPAELVRLLAVARAEGAARPAGGRADTAAGCVTTPVRPRSSAPVPALPSRQGKGTSTAEEWPLRTYLELGALPGAVPCARLHAKQVLWEWGLTELSESTELLVSELVTNAVRASQVMKWVPTVRLWLLSDSARILILVWDANPRTPACVDVNEEAESGRGLLLVSMLSARWNWYVSPGLDGKIVWCETSLDAQAGRDRPLPRAGFNQEWGRSCCVGRFR